MNVAGDVNVFMKLWPLKNVVHHSGNLLKLATGPYYLATMAYKEIASCLAMTAKARRHLILPVKERELIRHCEKTHGMKSLLFCKKLKGVFVAIF